MLPIAARLRPKRIEDFFGQTHLTGPGKPLYLAYHQKKLHSMILWGPPGTGKTTLAELLSKRAGLAFESLSAVMAGVKDIREAVERARWQAQSSVLFIDEIHRFNKAQQDALLPFVEDGTFILIGATTENPSFELNQALLSRARVHVLKLLNEDELLCILERALSCKEQGLGSMQLQLAEGVADKIIAFSQGDARKLLNTIDLLAQWIEAEGVEPIITDEVLKQGLGSKMAHFDKSGEHFYDQISALHKSVRGSSVDGALYWLSRMILGGCDLSYLSRRIIRMSSEDIGNADPKALGLALDAARAVERLGQPEGELALAQIVSYLALAPKSNAVYKAYGKAKETAEETSHLPVPLHLRNAPTKLMKSLDYGKDYQYDHDYPNALAGSQTYFPEEMKRTPSFYQPTNRGLEIKIAEKLKWLKEQRESVQE